MLMDKVEKKETPTKKRPLDVNLTSLSVDNEFFMLVISGHTYDFNHALKHLHIGNPVPSGRCVHNNGVRAAGT